MPFIAREQSLFLLNNIGDFWHAPCSTSPVTRKECPMIDEKASLPRYDYMAKLTRSRWAWEALRRNADFRADAACRPKGELSRKEACRNITIIKPRIDQTIAESWGLAFIPDPNLNALDADVFWSDGIYPRKLTVQVSPRQPSEMCEIYERTTSVCRVVHFSDRVGREQLLLKTRDCVVQVRCEGLSLLSLEPVRMKVVFDKFSELDAKLKLLERAMELYGDPKLDDAPRWTRETLALRNAMIALDCIEAGLSHFDCAKIIYGLQRAAADWKAPGGAMKSEMKRAFRKGVYLREGGYRDLLSSQKVKRLAA